jgi:hypothetical protein
VSDLLVLDPDRNRVGVVWVVVFRHQNRDDIYPHSLSDIASQRLEYVLVEGLADNFKVRVPVDDMNVCVRPRRW